MRKIGKKAKVLAAVLLAGVLSAGSVAAQASTDYAYIGGYKVSGSTTITASSALARTDCSGAPTNARTGVRAVYYYWNPITSEVLQITDSEVADRGSMVCFSAPTNYESVSVEAFHYVTLDGESWSTNTQETY